ncbi:hypothetical protein HHK36_005852 [Tetracentron sinense]|uniref:Uncharacterized protein n=1 Tax=Tetracentron sinense TaxID=13715 RepID=A0A835DMQ1_TETSI|nr:hypothetical protein HHK36_005852 [Tetracentron sinense]
MASGLNLNLRPEYFMPPTQTNTMLPLNATYEVEEKPFPLCMPTLSVDLQGMHQYQNPILVPNLITPPSYPLVEALRGWVNMNEFQDSGVRIKRQRTMNEGPFVMGDWYGSSQFQLNGLGNVFETARTATFGVGNGGLGFLPNYQYPILNGFTIGSSYQVNGETVIDAAERRYHRMIRARRQQKLWNIRMLQMENEILKNILSKQLLKKESAKNRPELLRTFMALATDTRQCKIIGDVDA